MHNSWEFTVFRQKIFQKFLLIGNAHYSALSAVLLIDVNLTLCMYIPQCLNLVIKVYQWRVQNPWCQSLE